MAEPVQTVTPHLVVSDADAAIEFYKQALGATEVFRMPAKDGKRLLHVGHSWSFAHPLPEKG